MLPPPMKPHLRIRRILGPRCSTVHGADGEEWESSKVPARVSSLLTAQHGLQRRSSFSTQQLLTKLVKNKVKVLTF